MTALEALVWLVGIVTAGITIRYTVGAWIGANKVLEEIRWDFRKIVATLEEGKNEDENAPEGR